MTPSLLCAWLRSLGWRRMPDPLSPWDCYQRSGELVEVPMLGEARDWPRWARECVQDAARAMGWSAERAWADYYLGPWRAEGPEMDR